MEASRVLDYYKLKLDEYSVSQYPKEACGLIVNYRGKPIFKPCKNIATTPEEDFVIDPIDQVRALQDGELLAVFHSHTKYAERPSDLDSLGCVKLGVPWIIYSTITGRFFVQDPKDKQEALSGRTYLYGLHDCWSLVRDLYKQELNIDLMFGTEEDPNWWRYRNTFVDSITTAGFTEVNNLQKYDVLLMLVGTTNKPNHSAVYYGDGLIYHHPANRLSCKEVYGGYWNKVTSHICRHKELL